MSVSTATFADYSVAQAFEATVHPRWDEFKARGNQALKEGNYEAAIQDYTRALKIADASNVDSLFEAASERPANSAGPKLAAIKEDIAPIIRRFIPGPVLSRGEPNKPAAVCLANRAAVHLKLGRNVAAVADARAATIICPEYLKGHFRLKQALGAAGFCLELEQALWPDGLPWEWQRPLGPDAGTIDAGMKKFRIASEQDPQHDGMRPPGMCIWLGFRLVICRWLDPAVYYPIYEDPRARDWREHARRVMANELTPDCPYDYRYLRVHMEVFHAPGACPSERSDYLAVGLNVIPPRPCLFASGARPAAPRMASILGQMPPPPLPSVDYRYLRLPRKLSEQEPSATGRMIATALSDMFERDDLPMVTMLGIASPLSIHADAIRDHFAERGLLDPRPGRELEALVVLFTAGHCIKHRKFGYRGVIVGTADHTCTMDERWIIQMGVDDLPRGRYQPWYRVLVDVRDRSPAQMCYVCHENIVLWLDPPDEGSALGPIDHPDVHRAFTAYDKAARLYVAPRF